MLGGMLRKSSSLCMFEGGGGDCSVCFVVVSCWNGLCCCHYVYVGHWCWKCRGSVGVYV